MRSAPDARAALARLGIVAGLPPAEVRKRLEGGRRLLTEAGRGMSFYLAEIEDRRLYLHLGCASTAEYAAERHGLSPRRTIDLIAQGRVLHDQQQIRAARNSAATDRR